jgi:alkylation response protein AidB-like acyl-CoA dehydrogenase
MNFNLTDEQRMWQEVVHDFVFREVKSRANHVDEAEEFNMDAARKMGNIGLLGLNIEQEYGGAGVDAISAAIAIEELGWGCGSTALTLAAHNGLGSAPITIFGNEDQKERFLPEVSGSKTGDTVKLAALALTEPDAGSDLKGGVRTRAILEGDEWVINGSKMWCTNASLASFIITLVRTSQTKDSRSLSLIIVPTNTPGLHIGPAEKKMGLKGSPTHAVTYENVRVSKSNLLGEVGHGLRQTLTILDGGRIGIGALSVGLAQASFEEAVRYAKERKAFELPLAEFQAIQWMIADSATAIQTARLMVYHAAWLKDQRRPFTKEAAMAKLYATEMAEKVCRDAIQIHGGYGYSREYPVERIYRDARLMTIGEGTSEIQRMVIARNILQN